RIDALNLGVGVRTADELGIGHAHQFDVVDVAAFAGDETAVFLADGARADAFATPCKFLPAGDVMSRRLHRSPAVGGVWYEAAIPPPAQPSCGRRRPAPP